MIRNGLAAVFFWFSSGGLLLDMWLLSLTLAVLGGKGWGRRAALREIDEGRAAVAEAVERATGQRITELVPGQRRERD